MISIERSPNAFPFIFSTCESLPKIRSVDNIIVDDDVHLPKGMTTADIQDAISWAKRQSGQDFPLDVHINDRVFYSDSGEMRGLACLDGKRIELSAQAASALIGEEPPKGYSWGSPYQQLWAAAFEETLHAARIISGQFDKSSYYHPPKNCSQEEFERYNGQPEEAVINNALNIVLKERFGSNVIFVCKTVVIVKQPFYGLYSVEGSLILKKHLYGLYSVEGSLILKKHPFYLEKSINEKNFPIKIDFPKGNKLSYINNIKDKFSKEY